MKRALFVLLVFFPLAGCDQLSERMGMPDPQKITAEGKAVGSGCRHAGRGLEDCYRLNPRSPKAAVFEGWKEMNEYMLKNNMQAVPPEYPPDFGKSAKKSETAEQSTGQAAHAETGKEAAKNKETGGDTIELKGGGATPKAGAEH